MLPLPMQVLAVEGAHTRLAPLQPVEQGEGLRARRVAAIVLRVPRLYAIGQLVEAFYPLERAVHRVSDDGQPAFGFDVTNDGLWVSRLDAAGHAEAEHVHAPVAVELKAGDESEAFVRERLTLGLVTGELGVVESLGVIG